MRVRRWLALLMLGLALFSAAPLLAAPIMPASSAAGERRIFVTSNGWHSGIVVARADLPEAVLPEVADFASAAFLEFGWGDADFYTTPRAGLGLALLAAFPGPAVMHIAGLRDHPAMVYPTVTVLSMVLTDQQLQRLVVHIAASVARTGTGRVPSNAPGLYEFSKFYPATGRFSAFNTCNTWTARALAAAGLAVDPDGVQSADELLRRIRPLMQPG